MSVIIAAAHILGALIALFAFESAVLALSAWELKRNQKAAAEEISIALGIPIESLDNTENASKVVRFNAERFSGQSHLIYFEIAYRICAVGYNLDGGG